MKRAILGHEVLDKDTYQTFKATLERMGATLSAQMLTRYGEKGVKVEGGEILYKIESIRMTRQELEAFDEKAHWQKSGGLPSVWVFAKRGRHRGGMNNRPFACSF
jgi:hypothetical protein